MEPFHTLWYNRHEINSSNIVIKHDKSHLVVLIMMVLTIINWNFLNRLLHIKCWCTHFCLFQGASEQGASFISCTASEVRNFTSPLSFDTSLVSLHSLVDNFFFLRLMLLLIKHCDIGSSGQFSEVEMEGKKNEKSIFAL